VHIQEACKYASEDAWMTLKVYNFLVGILDSKLLEIAKEVEFEFVKTLLFMENRGIEVDTKLLESFKKSADELLKKLTHKIYELSGSEFNINSTKQLSQILFNTLNLPAKKRTKSGYSTDESVLEGLRDAHEIIPKLLKYREIYKLKSTYIEPLIKLAKKSKKSRVYTSFLQTGTATGRLSSKNPNLQNIPVRDEYLNIRDAFVAKEGCLLVSADYSQIELRLLAHFSKDRALIEAFNNKRDIHLETAKKIFGQDEAAKKRGVAKSINFGLIYGMGARRLSQSLGISQKEAKSYIDSYFKSFPTVKDYLESIKQDTLQNGYVETLIGRRRVFDFASVSDFQKATLLREAVNTRFQGSAADIIKLAMNRFEKILDENCAMLLQIHDELIFEVKESEIERYLAIIKETMESIYKLEVDLEVDINSAKSWGRVKS
jgi:DNA polymerase-1